MVALLDYITVKPFATSEDKTPVSGRVRQIITKEAPITRANPAGMVEWYIDGDDEFIGSSLSEYFNRITIHESHPGFILKQDTTWTAYFRSSAQEYLDSFTQGVVFYIGYKMFVTMSPGTFVAPLDGVKSFDSSGVLTEIGWPERFDTRDFSVKGRFNPTISITHVPMRTEIHLFRKAAHA